MSRSDSGRLSPEELIELRRLWDGSDGIIRTVNVGRDFMPLDEPDDDSKRLFGSIGSLLDEIEWLAARLVQLEEAGDRASVDERRK